MSCQLTSFAWFDPNCVRKRLFVDTTDLPEVLLGRPESTESQPSSSDTTWLSECLSCLSPSREILVFAKKANVVILTLKWENQKKSNVPCKYVVLWSGSLQVEKTEQITSILCLPLASIGKRSHHGADWTCIVVGYSTGYVRFYTENGSLLISELFSEERVVKIKCHSFCPPLCPGEVEHVEELLIVYQSAIVSLSGFALFQTLRGCRSHLAKVKANCSESITPPPLAYKKWGFEEQRVGSPGSSLEEVGVTDCEVVGPCTPNSFDHLHHHHLMSSQLTSMARFKPRTSATSMVVATGSHPFLGFHYSVEGAGRQTIYQDVARAVTDRLKGTLSNTVSSWIFGGPSGQDKGQETKPTVEPADPMECRFGLCDPLRRGEDVVLTQNRRLSAVTDNLGRIILVDNFKGIAVRLWKGYRDAHCGWLEVMEESLHLEQQKHLSKSTGLQGPNAPDRKAHFLIVHCPRSSFLQVLSVQKGSKIATIPVAKGSFFVYMSHGLVGTNNVVHKRRRGSVDSTCIIIEPNGYLKEVLVPFHFALSEQSSEKVRDFHLIRRMKKLLRSYEQPCSVEILSQTTLSEVCSILNDLHLVQSLAVALHAITTHRNTSAQLCLASIDSVLQHVEKMEKEMQSSSSLSTLWVMCQQLKQLIILYSKAMNSFDDDELESAEEEAEDGISSLKDSSQLSEEERKEVIMEKFKLREYEAKDLLVVLQVLKLARSDTGKRGLSRVSFADEQVLPLHNFLSCFDVTTIDSSAPDADNEVMTMCKDTFVPISLKPSTQEQNFVGNVCHLLFHRCLSSSETHENWKLALMESGINPKDLLLMVMSMWIRYGWQLICVSLIDALQRLLSIVHDICSMPGIHSCIHTLPWWEDVRAMLSRCESPFVALLGAIATRVVATNKEMCGPSCLQIPRKETLKKQDAKVDREGMTSGHKEEDWEQVSMEGMAWDRLIHGLEDVAYLEAAIACGPVQRNPFSISLEDVFCKGKGNISEMVASWVLLCNEVFDSKLWGLNAVVEFLHNESPSPEDSMVDSMQSSEMMALGLLRTLRNRFPQSLSTSALLANIAWECSRHFASLKCNAPILNRALEWIQEIPSLQIRRGVCGLLWSIHLEHRLRAAVQLLECYPHVEAIPEKVILDEVGLTSLVMLQDLFVNSHKFLELIAELAHVNTEEGAEEGEGEYDDEEGHLEQWGPPGKGERGPNQMPSSGPPLVKLAAVQPPMPSSLSRSPIRLVLFHQLALAVCMITKIHPKGPTSLTQPISQLFSEKERALLLSLPDGDLRSGRNESLGPILIKPRMLFITRSISTVCRSVDYSQSLSKELTRLALTTAEVFSLPMDDIHRHLVCELYSCGHDQKAEEMMSVVVDKQSLASQLLVIVLQRLKHYLDHCGNGERRSQVMATFSPASLAKLTDQFHNQLVCKDVPMSATEQLLSILVAYLDEESKLYSEAINILDAVRVLKSQE